MTNSGADQPQVPVTRDDLETAVTELNAEFAGWQFWVGTYAEGLFLVGQKFPPSLLTTDLLVIKRSAADVRKEIDEREQGGPGV